MVAGLFVLPVVLSHGSRVSESLAEQPMIRHYPNDKDAGTQVASDIFTTFHADTPDGERFFQAMIGRFLQFALISSVSPQACQTHSWGELPLRS